MMIVLIVSIPMISGRSGEMMEPEEIEREKCKYQDGWCGFNFYGFCRLSKCVEERLTIEDLQQIDGYLQEVRQKYLKPYREKECLKVEALCRKIEAIIYKVS